LTTPSKNNTRPEEWGTSCFSGYVKNLFASTAYQARFDKNICETVDKDSEGFTYLRLKYSEISKAKMK
jgi:hypothetical protein